MNKNDFFSNNSYIFLPTRKNPKVVLAVNNSSQADNAFRLYNPFSFKAKCLKKTIWYLFSYFPTFAKLICRAEKGVKSDFLRYLEVKLEQTLVSSVYFATTGDKVVIQLQSQESEVIGYIKYPLNKVGLIHLKNEISAIEALSKIKLIDSYILKDKFDKTPFVLLPPLDGNIDSINDSDALELSSQFKRIGSFQLAEHPRIIQLKISLRANGLAEYIHIIERICNGSKKKYSLVYEHGDFTPWNIIKVNNKYVPFDFEHFVEDGIEYFDLIKYYYQIGKLIEGFHANDLLAHISTKVDAIEIEELLKVFLIKEILRNTEENEECNFEIKMLEMMENK